jgi:DUF4097 and DUF4098 domain-containing protein YvlB
MAALTLSGCYIDVGQLQHRVSTYSVSAPVHTLVVNGGVGDVNVTGGAGQVSVTERISYRHGVPHPEHAVRAGKLTLTSNCPGSETCSVEYHVRVPGGTAVRIDDGVGKISLAALTGQVTAHTNAGGIGLRSVSGTIQATDHAGSISGTGVSSAHATLSTNVGSIDVTFSAAPARVAATANVGSISLRLPGGVRYAVDAKTSVGSTHVTVPRSGGSAHTITARTQTGSVTVRPA